MYYGPVRLTEEEKRRLTALPQAPQLFGSVLKFVQGLEAKMHITDGEGQDPATVVVAATSKVLVAVRSIVV